MAVRYPRGKELYRPEDFASSFQTFDCYGAEESECLLVTYGRLFSYACKVKEILEAQGKRIRILKLNRIKPIDPCAISLATQYRQVFFFEEESSKAVWVNIFTICWVKKDSKEDIIYLVSVNLLNRRRWHKA